MSPDIAGHHCVVCHESDKSSFQRCFSKDCCPFVYLFSVVFITLIMLYKI